MLLNQSTQEIKVTIRSPNPRIIGREQSKYSQCKDPGNIVNKIIGENFPNLKKQIAINTQDAYRTPNK